MSSTATVTETPCVSPKMQIQDSPQQRNSHDIALESLGGIAPSSDNASRELANVARVQQHWNRPKTNIWRLAAVFLSFLNVGANDASYGALIPFLEPYYHVNYLVVSLIFLSPFVGYTIAAFTCDRVHMLAGQRGVAFVGPLCRIIAYIVLSVHPPYPVIICVYIFAGYGNGLADAAWNAWVGDMVSANQLLGLMHGFYGLGATISPLVATAMVTKYGLEWYTFYYIMVAFVALELACGCWAFWPENALEFRRKNTSSQQGGGRTRKALQEKVTWICAAFLLIYVGCEVSIGGWIITFMIKIRKGEPFASGITATGFWLGITVGRVTLGFITAKFGERWSVSAYLVLGIVSELLFWLVPNFIVSAIAIGFVGFFLGPMFPAAVIAMTKLLPKQMHVSAIGFATGIGGVGSGVLPFAVGAIAQVRGVQTLEPIALAMLVVLLGLWLLLPKIPMHQHQS